MTRYSGLILSWLEDTRTVRTAGNLSRERKEGRQQSSQKKNHGSRNRGQRAGERLLADLPGKAQLRQRPVPE